MDSNAKSTKLISNGSIENSNGEKGDNPVAKIEVKMAENEKNKPSGDGSESIIEKNDSSEINTSSKKGDDELEIINSKIKDSGDCNNELNGENGAPSKVDKNPVSDNNNSNQDIEKEKGNKFIFERTNGIQINDSVKSINEDNQDDEEGGEDLIGANESNVEEDNIINQESEEDEETKKEKEEIFQKLLNIYKNNAYYTFGFTRTSTANRIKQYVQKFKIPPKEVKKTKENFRFKYKKLTGMIELYEDSSPQELMNLIDFLERYKSRKFDQLLKDARAKLKMMNTEDKNVIDFLNRKTRRPKNKNKKGQNNESVSDNDDKKINSRCDILSLENQFIKKQLKPSDFFKNDKRVLYLLRGSKRNKNQLEAFLNIFDPNCIKRVRSLNQFEDNTSVDLVIYEICNKIINEEVDFFESVKSQKTYYRNINEDEEIFNNDDNNKNNNLQNKNKKSKNSKNKNPKEISINAKYLLIVSLYNYEYFKDENKNAYDFVKKLNKEKCFYNFYIYLVRKSFYLEYGLIKSKKDMQNKNSISLDEDDE